MRGDITTTVGRARIVVVAPPPAWWVPPAVRTLKPQTKINRIGIIIIAIGICPAAHEVLVRQEGEDALTGLRGAVLHGAVEPIDAVRVQLAAFWICGGRMPALMIHARIIGAGIAVVAL